MAGGWKIAVALARRIRAETELVPIMRVRYNYEGHIIARIGTNGREQITNSPGGTWYPAWYSKTGLGTQGTREVIATLAKAAARQDAQGIYRGESRLYPSIRSTLSRKLDTTDMWLLKQAGEDYERRAKSRKEAEGQTAERSEIQSSLQHRGAPTNFVDFTTNIWVALYFATNTQDNEPGRVWRYKGRTGKTGSGLLDAGTNTDSIGQARGRAQSGVLIEAREGVIPCSALEEIVIISNEEKMALREFLSEEIGLNEAALFPDLQALVDEKGVTVRFEVAVRKWMKEIACGQAERVVDEIQNVIQNNGQNLDESEGCRYCEAVAYGKLGRVQDALATLAGIWNDGQGSRLPRPARRNRQVWRTAERKGAVSYARNRTNTEVFEELWWSDFDIQLVEVDQKDPTQKKKFAGSKMRIGPGEITIPDAR